MSKLYDIAYPIETKEGNKPKWVKCGAIIQTQKGPRMKLDVIPVSCTGWFSLFEPKPKEEKPPVVSGDAFNDDVPF